MKIPSVNPYHISAQKRFLDLSTALATLIILTPFITLISFLIKIKRGRPVFFRQKRAGKNGKVFTLIKFRTMRMGAEKEQKNLKHLNAADGPVFKIYNDPRYTKFGKILARTGLDELPQLINVLKGEMSLVGPRPLPVYEAKKLTGAQKVRELVKPGITSSWVTSGAHKLKFSQWMKLDAEYVESASLLKDLSILFKTAKMVFTLVLRRILKAFAK